MKSLADDIRAYTPKATAGERAVDPAAGSAPQADVCQRCGGIGWCADRTSQNLPFLVECACMLQKRATRAAQEERQRRDLVLARLQQQFGRLTRCTFETFAIDRPLAPLDWTGEVWTFDEQHQALRYALERSVAHANGAPGWLYFYGPCGSGKSHLAAAITNELACQGQSAAYASVPELLGFIRAGFGDNTAGQRLETLKTVDVLVLDDLGTEQATEWVMEQLFILVNSRYIAERKTIITSNVRLDALPVRIASRIAELAEEIVLPVADYRRRERA